MADVGKVCHLVVPREPERPPVALEVCVFCWTPLSGVVQETEEMKPAWFAEADVPYHLMWEDDKHW